jgi:hypothetical protein
MARGQAFSRQKSAIGANQQHRLWLLRENRLEQFTTCRQIKILAARDLRYVNSSRKFAIDTTNRSRY